MVLLEDSTSVWIHFFKAPSKNSPLWVRLWKLLFRPTYTHVVYEVGPGAVYEYGPERKGWYDSDVFFADRDPEEWDTVQLIGEDGDVTEQQLAVLSELLMHVQPLEKWRSIRYLFTPKWARFEATMPRNCSSIGVLFTALLNVEAMRGTPDELFAELTGAARPSPGLG